ncbi:MAG: tetratricopeptide repeat protein, partial [Candidatus Omnitrophica bacterium]|nr:tetratricopeptide repeat protein [Candidatus Omnitrophota bacterium]
RLYLANSMYNMSRYDAALAEFMAIEDQSSEVKLKVMAAYQIGWCLHNLRKEPEAVAAFERFLRAYPDSELAPDARFWFGEHYRSKGKLDKARGYFDSIPADFPSCDLIKEAFMQAAIVLSEEGKSGEAIARFEDIAARFPGSDTGKMAYRKIAKIKKIEKDFDQAIEYYRKALTGDNTELNAEIQYEIAESYEMKGDLRRASDEFLKVMDLYSNGVFWSVRAQLKCAQAFEAIGKPDEASRLYEKLAGMEVEESDFAKKRLELLKRTDI